MSRLFQWHLGMFAKEYTPTYRGFESHYGYYQGCEDYLDHTYQAHVSTTNIDYTHTYLNIYINIYMCVCVYLYSWLHLHLQITNMVLQFETMNREINYT